MMTKEKKENGGEDKIDVMAAPEPVWPPMEEHMKVRCLERLVKALTGARDIIYHRYPMGDGRVVLTDICPEDIKFHGYDEGISIDYYPNAVRVTDREILPEFRRGPLDGWDVRIDAWIYFWEDPWKTIDELRKRVDELVEELKRRTKDDQ